MEKVLNRPKFAADLTNEEYDKYWVKSDAERRKHLLENFGGEDRIEVKIAQAKWEAMQRTRRWIIGILVTIVIGIAGILA